MAFTNTRDIRIEWGDCDPAGIIFYPTYFRWIDAASWALFTSVGYGPKWMKRERCRRRPD